MSLILEALRKSEAERQRGQAPGLFVEQRAGAKARHRRAPTWVWVAGVLFFGVIVAWGWREYTRQTVPFAAAPDAPAEILPPDVPATMDQPVVIDDPVQTSPTPEAPAPAYAAPAISTTPVAAPPPAATAASAPETALPAPPTLASAPAASTETLSPEAPPVASPTPADAPIPAATDEAYVPRLAELPASERTQLPPLKLSMHVYTDDPAQRFVILDGQRLREGASPGAGLVIEQIRRDGLVLSVNGRRVLLARP